jgi:hypothetical protein
MTSPARPCCGGGHTVHRAIIAPRNRINSPRLTGCLVCLRRTHKAECPRPCRITRPASPPRYLCLQRGMTGWNLLDAAEHCGLCHAPKNAIGSERAHTLGATLKRNRELAAHEEGMFFAPVNDSIEPLAGSRRGVRLQYRPRPCPRPAARPAVRRRLSRCAADDGKLLLQSGIEFYRMVAASAKGRLANQAGLTERSQL